MITFKKEDIWETDAEAIVIPVNCVGVAGAGLAEQAKNKHPEWFKQYQRTCRELKPVAGQTEGITFKFINAYTKNHWKESSKYSDVATCIWKIAKSKHQYKSIAIPALGCGFGNLKWEVVRNFMVEQFTDSEIEFQVYEPH
jgi:O-acetyl-ADP-ribose deacetylase (regulator of RNase III)